MTDNQKLVPEMRFKGFTHAWTQRKLGELSEFSKGSGYSKQDLQKTGKPIILYGRLYTNYETVISNVDTFATENHNSVISKGNEVVVPASGESSDDIARATVVTQSDIILGGDLNIIRVHSELDSTFLALTISNGQQQKELSKRAQGKSIVHLYNSDLKEVRLKYPTLPEQTSIGTFFRTLDTTITLHQRKLDSLKKLKKAYLQQLFPQGGEKVPRVRFEGFTDDWTVRKLGEIFNYKSSKHLSSSFQNVSCGYPLFDANKLIGNIKNFDQKSEYISIIKDGAGVGRIEKREAKSSVISTMGYLLPYETDINFSFSILQTINFTGFVAGTTIPHIYFRDYGQKNIFTPPTFKEQTAIGNFFRTLDNQITTQQTKLDKIKRLKSAYLQKMFI